MTDADLAVTTIADFVKVAVSESSRIDSEYYWRGHSDINYKLIPGIYRKKDDLSTKEHLLIKEAILRHPEEFSSKRTYFEKLAMLQHYGFPTRLLDVTENPLVALYFACTDKPRKDGAVVLFKLKRENIRYFDSDTVTVLSAISSVPSNKFNGFNDELKKLISESNDHQLGDLRTRIARNKSQSAVTTLTNYMASASVNDSIRQKLITMFNECALIQTLAYEIRAEKPHFRSIIDSGHFNNSMSLVKSRYDNQRIAAQQGAFLLFGIKDGDKNKPSDFEKENIQIESITIPAVSKKEMLRSLAHFGISDERMFPEMIRSAEVVRRKFKL